MYIYVCIYIYTLYIFTYPLSKIKLNLKKNQNFMRFAEITSKSGQVRFYVLTANTAKVTGCKSVTKLLENYSFKH